MCQRQAFSDVNWPYWVPCTDFTALWCISLALGKRAQIHLSNYWIILVGWFAIAVPGESSWCPGTVNIWFRWDLKQHCLNENCLTLGSYHGPVPISQRIFQCNEIQTVNLLSFQLSTLGTEYTTHTAALALIARGGTLTISAFTCISTNETVTILQYVIRDCWNAPLLCTVCEKWNCIHISFGCQQLDGPVLSCPGDFHQPREAVGVSIFNY